MTPDTPSDPPLQEHAGIAVTRTGSGPPLVMIHGMPGSHRDFRWLAPVVEPHWEVIRPDLPGFGATPAHIEPSTDIQRRADVVVRLLDALGHERVVLVGHSFGGVLAACLAAHHPDRVAALALIASPGLRPHRSIRRFPLRRAMPTLLSPPLRTLFRPAHRAMYRLGGFPPVHSDETIEYVSLCIAALDFTEVATLFRALQIPTGVAWAEDDRLLEVEIGEELSRICPTGPRICFKSGGHNLQKTRAVELGDLIQTLGEMSGIV